MVKMLKYGYLILLLCTTNYTQETEECIPGEQWFERCQICRCEENKVHCIKTQCSKDICFPGLQIKTNTKRCFCPMENPENIICVELAFQESISGKPCSPNSYYYDSCTFCNCINNKLQCIPIAGCMRTNGGTCIPGETKMEFCHECTCSKTQFRKCIPNYDCLLRKRKPGKCRPIVSYYNIFMKQLCTNSKIQECYSDYSCPGQQKCCQVVDCYLRCQDPF